MLITIFPCLWHGICEAFTAEIAEDARLGGLAAGRGRRAEKDRDRGKATANGTAFTAEACPERAERVEGTQSTQRKAEMGERQGTEGLRD
jgi:hypothetical protein